MILNQRRTDLQSPLIRSYRIRTAFLRRYRGLMPSFHRYYPPFASLEDKLSSGTSKMTKEIP